jgi:hypothetical protein
VNITQRSVTFDASIPNHPNTGLQYSWTSTGQNGTVSPLTGAQAQYSMTQTTVAPGFLDQVQVIIRGNIDPTTPNVLVPLASADAFVDGNLQFSFEVNPDFSNTGFGQTKNLSAVVRNSTGGVYVNPAQLPVLMVWTSTELHGSLDLHNPNHKTASANGVFTAKDTAQSRPLPPRIDQITVDFYVGYWKEYTTSLSAFGFSKVRVDSKDRDCSGVHRGRAEDLPRELQGAEHSEPGR